jgi:peptidoglycan/xylan/chitin deacetylase (PgdA/CDA1 family)
MSVYSDFIRKNGPEVRSLFTGGIPDFVKAFRAKPLQNGVPVFCYHLVEPSLFERDMIFLRHNGFHTVTSDNLLDYINLKADLPVKSIALTFDDGPVNFFRVAFPLLQKYKRKAILFIAPGLHRFEAEEAYQAERPCTLEELDQMHSSGLVDIQAHTWVHRSLTSWPDLLPLAGIKDDYVSDRRQDELSMEEDLRQAREWIESRFGKSARHLAWPCYDGTDEAVKIARSVGYQAFWAGTAPRHPLNIPGQKTSEIVRLSGEFVRRLPGRDRLPLATIMARRYCAAIKAHIKSS